MILNLIDVREDAGWSDVPIKNACSNEPAHRDSCGRIERLKPSAQKFSLDESPIIRGFDTPELPAPSRWWNIIMSVQLALILALGFDYLYDY
jgi:hypothetical protein